MEKSARPLLLGMNDASGVRMERGAQDMLFIDVEE
jgi:hypothetical protein